MEVEEFNLSVKSVLMIMRQIQHLIIVVENGSPIMISKTLTRQNVLVEAIWILVKQHFSAQFWSSKGDEQPREGDPGGDGEEAVLSYKQDLKLIQQFLKTSLVLNSFDEAISKLDALAAQFP